MNLVLVVSFILVCLLAAHSYYKRGSRLTFNFFLFAFIVTFIKEAPGRRLDGILAQDHAAPFEFLNPYGPAIIGSLTGLVGWIFTFYLGWSIAEKIIKRVEPLSKRVFPTLLLSGLVIMSISYSVEATAVRMGWWRWKIEDLRLASFLIGVPFMAFEAWASFSLQYLLLPYFLIECSTLNRAPWKGVFFIIPFIHNLLANCQLHMLRVFEERLIFLLLVIMSFTSSLRFDYSGIKIPRGTKISGSGWFKAIPILVLFTMLSILVFFDITILKDYYLLITILPLLVLILLAVRTIPLHFIIIFIIVASFFAKEKVVIAVVPLAVFLIFMVFAKLKKPKLGHGS